MIGYKLSKGALSSGLLPILPLCLIWYITWLEFGVISHIANYLPKSLITKAKKESYLKISKKRD